MLFESCSRVEEGLLRLRLRHAHVLPAAAVAAVYVLEVQVHLLEPGDEHHNSNEAISHFTLVPYPYTILM